jgi:hypothetical protein
MRTRTQSQQQIRAETPDSRWSDEPDARKVSAITSGIARDESVAFDFRVRPNVKVRQRRSLRAAAAPIFQKGLRRDPARRLRQSQPPKYGRIEPPIKIGGGAERRSEFCVNDRVDEDRSLPGCGSELALRPREPNWIGCRDVQQGVRVKKNHSSPRVSAITSRVLTPGIARPRACGNQLSTGAGIVRSRRCASSHRANCSTCGSGSFSIAASISAMLLIAAS